MPCLRENLELQLSLLDVNEKVVSASDKNARLVFERPETGLRPTTLNKYARVGTFFMCEEQWQKYIE